MLWGAGRPATETTLLHMEDFQIPENLSRFAVKAGMWGFIKKMSPYMQSFIDDRRVRGVDPNELDAQAVGASATSLGKREDGVHKATLSASHPARRVVRKVVCGVVAVAMIGILGRGDKWRNHRGSRQ